MKDLIGQKVNLKASTQRIVLENLDLDFEHTSYEIDDPVMEEKLMEFRVHLPGRMFTADFKPYRQNVQIDVETGLITRVWLG